MLVTTSIRKLSVRTKRFVPIDRALDQPFAFVIEDPVIPLYNPAHGLLHKSSQFTTLIYELQKAYQLLSAKDLSSFTLPPHY